MSIDSEHDVIAARRRARELSAALNFAPQDQTRIATSVMEVARMLQIAHRGGRVEFSVDDTPAPQRLGIRLISPVAPSALQANVDPDNARSGLGLLAGQRLMDACRLVEEAGGGAAVELSKTLPERAKPVTAERALELSAMLARSHGEGSYDELQRQNRELVNALGELRERQEDLSRLTRELEDTNRGVVALYAELEQRAEYLRRADESKSRFLSNMSHEFRTPLSSIRALSNLLIGRVDGELTDEQEKQVRLIRQAAQDLSDTVDDLLDIAKIEAGKIEVRPGEFEADNLFSALRGMFRPLLTNPAVDLVFDVSSRIPPVRTDEKMVTQIMRNFISNALKFTVRGEIRVSALYDAETKMITFAVADTGIGIAPEHQHVVFEEFGQIPNDLQQFVKGTGLGLPLCKKLAVLLGGDVTLRSEAGQGSTFAATLPCVFADHVASLAAGGKAHP
ncbi:ATP-binding protein [Paraburkholderia sp.]|uniref:ATP-binding protein n=1 Tax=Paraburkholderia sp. TaxID=1926495 RepID=UPI002384FB66|nr:ATP-binding protein [Paraburkholderia sp.]MDE1181837.1 ATP-binding protein [Paraburkholderia sp.]